MSDYFAIEYSDFERIRSLISQVPENAEFLINDYLHGEGAQILSDSITSFIPESTGRYAAHKNLRKVYKHKKTLKHAKQAQWFDYINGNLGVSVVNKRDYYYLYFVQHGYGTNKKYGPRDFGELGIQNVYDRLINGLANSLMEGILNG